MPAHPTIPSCNIFTLDCRYPEDTPEPQDCPTCGSAQYYIAEIDVAAYAEQEKLDQHAASIRKAAIQQVKGSNQSPEWLRNSQEFLEYEYLIISRGPLACTHLGIITPQSLITGMDGSVYIDGVLLPPDRSIKVTNHSPSGFSWGYGGSGPAQLALALLLEAGASEQEAQRHHQDFKWAHIATLDGDHGFQMPASIVTDWLSLTRNLSKTT